MKSLENFDIFLKSIDIEINNVCASIERQFDSKQVISADKVLYQLSIEII